MVRQLIFFIFSVMLLIAGLTLFCGCVRDNSDDIDPVDTYGNPGGDGPEVLYRPDTKPPLIPFPNDLVTRADDTTITGRRINIPMEGDTDLEREQKRQMRKLDGFGTNASIAVSFSSPIDLKTISNDSVFIVNVQQGAGHFGEIVPCDFETGLYPIEMENPESFHPYDAFSNEDNMLFGPGNRQNYYEDKTNTLLLRPLVPLKQSSAYAVVLSKRLKDIKGEPVRPPSYFKYITFPTQLAQTDLAVNVVNQNGGLPIEDVAFVWSFTTQTITTPFENVRKGIWGEGPFAYLADEFTPKITTIHKIGVENDGFNDPYLLGAGFIKKLTDIIIPLVPGTDGLPIDEMVNVENVDYIISGTYTTPLFLDTPDRYFNWDYNTGDARYGREEVPFYISVPKPTAANHYARPPYPVVIFQHANIRSRFDSIALANSMAQEGFATIGIDAAEHGPEIYLWAIYAVMNELETPVGIGDFTVDVLARLLYTLMYPSVDISGWTTNEVVDALFAPDTFFGSALVGRSPDLDGNGILDNGNNFYSADMFRTKFIDMQTVIDLFMLTKLLKFIGTDWDGDEKWSREEGDFNQDGTLDIAGEDSPIYFMGMSLGSILGAPFVAMEPNVETAVFNVPGGILTDILMRTQIPNVNEATRMDLMGPIVSGIPTRDGKVMLTFNNDGQKMGFLQIGSHPNDRVVMTNLDSDITQWKRIGSGGAFSISVGADSGDWVQLLVVNDEGAILEEESWVQEFRGLGVKRNEPLARYFVSNAQWIMDGVDPINFMPYLFTEPRTGNRQKNVLLQMCMPDTAVPTSAGIALARAAGFIDMQRQEKLKALGIFDFGLTTFDQANLPLQSDSKVGWRIHPGYNHEYLLAPRNAPNSIMYSFVAKNQAAKFFASDGQWIEDRLKVLVPSEFYLEGY